jgi:hypothetical protein
MICSDFFHIPIFLSLAFILSVLAITIISSMIATRGRLPKEIAEAAEEPGPPVK